LSNSLRERLQEAKCEYGKTGSVEKLNLLSGTLQRALSDVFVGSRAKTDEIRSYFKMYGIDCPETLEFHEAKEGISVAVIDLLPRRAFVVLYAMDLDGHYRVAKVTVKIGNSICKKK